MTNVAGIQFKENGKVYNFDVNNLDLRINLTVIVETEKGNQFGTVSSLEEVEVDKKKLKKVIRIATKKDYHKHLKNVEDAKSALEYCKRKAEELKLNMNVIECSYTFEREQLLFTFLSEERVDFRELVKDLAHKFHTRIELRQVGIRDKAKAVGGIGPCGRELCCVAFLQEFDSISINHAKTQNLALNPTKINGACGRLMCCLKYESEQYKEMKKGLPNPGKNVKYKGKMVNVLSVDVINGTYRVQTEDGIEEVKVSE